MEFKPYPKITRLEKSRMVVTQKLHGTNSQITIFKKENGELDLKVGSRNRWITPENDNFGFATFVHENKQEFVEKLGEGTHFGEWVGPGINSGEGLTEKTLYLFAWYQFPEDRPLPPRTKVVPVLYDGPINTSKIKEIMEDLKTNGSKIVEGFMRPEGIVIEMDGKKYKKVFEAEETKWTKTSGKKDKPKRVQKDYSHLLQPIRLEKLLSKDEALTREYPDSLGNICKLYIEDLIEEGQIEGDEDQVKATKKGCTGQVFKFIKEFIAEKNSL